MSLPYYRFNRLRALVILAMCVTAAASAQDQIRLTSRIVTAKIKVDDLSMIIVPVSINGSGPYDFLLDTGAAKSMVDRKLANELALPRVGEKTVVGALASTAMFVVHVNSLSVAGASVSGGEIFSSDSVATVSGKVRGVLGEDFLKNFDLLVDYRHQVIELESSTGSLADTAGGEHLPLQLDGMYQGQPARNRLVVSGSIPELGGRPMTLLLDSGTNHMVLFRDDLGARGAHNETVRAGFLGSWITPDAATRTFRSLSLGKSSVDDLTVVGLSRRPYADIDGLLPTSMFHSIFISHRDRFVILNPSFPKILTKPQESK
jgi:predicted aspartyl protease